MCLNQTVPLPQCGTALTGAADVTLLGDGSMEAPHSGHACFKISKPDRRLWRALYFSIHYFKLECCSEIFVPPLIIETSAPSASILI